MKIIVRIAKDALFEQDVCDIWCWISQESFFFALVTIDELSVEGLAKINTAVKAAEKLFYLEIKVYY